MFAGIIECCIPNTKVHLVIKLFQARGRVTLSTSQVEAAPPGKIFSIFTIG